MGIDDDTNDLVETTDGTNPNVVRIKAFDFDDVSTMKIVSTL